MSTSRVGRASRIASIGISVWPPAMTRASSSAASSAQASLDAGRPHIVEGDRLHPRPGPVLRPAPASVRREPLGHDSVQLIASTSGQGKPMPALQPAQRRAKLGIDRLRGAPMIEIATAGRQTTADGTYPTTCWECSTCCGALATVRDGRVIDFAAQPGQPPFQGRLLHQRYPRGARHHLWRQPPALSHAPHRRTRRGQVGARFLG